jgi:transcriptional regulator NrdR family protein
VSGSQLAETRPAVVRRLDSDHGMACPGCGSSDTAVRDSRPAGMNSIRRRRVCERCGERFTSYEFAGGTYDLIQMAVELDRMVRDLLPDDVALLRVIIREMRRRGKSR